MKSFAMLRTAPIEPDQGESRYFIDGKRVTQDEFEKMQRASQRTDSFQTYRFGGRWHFRSVCYA